MKFSKRETIALLVEMIELVVGGYLQIDFFTWILVWLIGMTQFVGIMYLEELERKSNLSICGN